MRYILIILISFLLIISCSNTNNVKKAKTLLDKKDYYEAIHILESIDNKTPYANFLLAEAYRGIRKFSMADSFYNKAMNDNIEFKNKVIDAYAEIALTEFLKGYNYNANTYWKKVLSLNPNYDIGIGFYFLGKEFYEKEDYNEAKRMFLNALNIAMTSKRKIETYRDIIDIYSKEGKYDTAYIYVQNAIEEFGASDIKNADFYIQKGEILYKIAEQKYLKQEYNIAINILREMINIGKPKSLLDDAYLLMGDIYFDLQEFEKAIPAYNKVKELSDIKLYGSQDNYKKANEKLKQIIKRTGG